MVNLAEDSPEKINSVLESFTEKLGNHYQVYILDEHQGRGLDFPSKPEIEAHGGVYLIIASLPDSIKEYE